MPERLKKIWDSVVDWWKKFDRKQKTLLISITAVVIVALIILAVVVSKPTMVTLITCSTTAQSSEVKSLLDDEGIDYEIASDALTFSVRQQDKATAEIILGANSIPTSGMTIDDVDSGGFSSTEADKQRRYVVYKEDYIADALKSLSMVDAVSVTLDLPTDDGTILSGSQEGYAAVILTLNSSMDDDIAAGIAKFIATEIGNDTTDNIQIIDSNANVLFSGGDSSTSIGAASTQLSYKQKYESLVMSQVKNVLVSSGLFDHAEGSVNLALNFDSTTDYDVQYSAPEGQTDGMKSSESVYTSDSTTSDGDIPGTDTNADDTTYLISNGEVTESSIEDRTTYYENNKHETLTNSDGGTVDYDNSSISVVMTNYVIYSEDTLKAAGELDDMTFDEFIAANSDPVPLEVSDEYYSMVSNATGIPVSNITLIAQQQPMFQYSSGGRSLSDYLQIILAVLVLVLLGYVVFRTLRKEKEPEIEEELSVESLLESTKESQDERTDIGYAEKSETRMLIEKFVEENPEAAAALLRNWLNEDWE